MRLLLAAFLLLPAAARAAGMPQLDFANPLTTSQVVWGAIIFIVLYILLSRFGLPKVATVLEERAKRIESDLDAARSVKASADAAMVEMTTAITKARGEAQAAINAALDQAKTAAAAQTAELNAKLEVELKDAETRINAARAAAMQALRQVATETATTVVTRLTGVSPEPSAIDGAVANALSARRIG